MSYLRDFCLFAYSGVQHILCFPRHVYLMLPVSLDCPFLIAPSVFSNVYILRSCIFWWRKLEIYKKTTYSKATNKLYNTKMSHVHLSTDGYLTLPDELEFEFEKVIYTYLSLSIKSLKIPKGQSESTNGRRTDNTMTKRKRTKLQTR